MGGNDNRVGAKFLHEQSKNLSCAVIFLKFIQLNWFLSWTRLGKMLKDALYTLGTRREGRRMGKDLLSKHKMSYSILL